MLEGLKKIVKSIGEGNPEKRPGAEGIEVQEITPEEVTMSGKTGENMPPDWKEAA